MSTTLLHEIAVSTIGYGVLMFAGALLAGPTRTATDPPLPRAVPARARPRLRRPRWSCLAIGILWWAPTPATRNPITAILLAILIALGFEGLRRRTAKEFPDANRKVAEQHGRERLSRATDTLRGWASAGAGRVRQAKPASAGEPGNGGSGPPTTTNASRRLERLGKLHDAGTVDDEEFRAEKARIFAA